MARNSLICAFAFTLVLILCHEVFGSHLKFATQFCKKCSSSSKHLDNSLSVANKGDGDHTTVLQRQERSSKVEHVDDFRPTAPGHSPGVGHSIKN
ncbi:hypothetical protein ACOSP7_023094 [Xanthoceras sorbifolium]